MATGKRCCLAQGQSLLRWLPSNNVWYIKAQSFAMKGHFNSRISYGIRWSCLLGPHRSLSSPSTNPAFFSPFLQALSRIYTSINTTREPLPQGQLRRELNLHPRAWKTGFLSPPGAKLSIRKSGKSRVSKITDLLY